MGVLLFEFFDGRKDGFGFEQHALAAAAEVVVGASMFVGGPVAELMRVDVGESLVAGALDDAFAERGEGDFGEKCDDIDVHGGSVMIGY